MVKTMKMQTLLKTLLLLLHCLVMKMITKNMILTFKVMMRDKIGMIMSSNNKYRDKKLNT